MCRERLRVLLGQLELAQVGAEGEAGLQRTACEHSQSSAGLEVAGKGAHKAGGERDRSQNMEQDREREDLSIAM